MSEKKNTPPVETKANESGSVLKSGKSVDQLNQEKKSETAKATAAKAATKPASTKSVTAKTTAKTTVTKSAAAKTTAAKVATKPASAKSGTAKTTAKATVTKSAATKTTAAKTAVKPASAKIATAKTTEKTTASKSGAVKKSTVVKAEEKFEKATEETISNTSLSEIPKQPEVAEEVVSAETATEVAEIQPEHEVVIAPEVPTPSEATPASVGTVPETTAPAETVAAIAPAEIRDEPVETVSNGVEKEEKTQEELEREADLEEAKREQEARDKKAEEDKLLPPDPDALLEVRHLKKYFVLKKTVTGKALQTLRAVDDVSFTLKAGQTLGIVGESGCGKTTMGRTILKLHQPSGGQIFFKQEDIAGYKSKQMRSLRTQMQIIFQDPYSSLPPRSTVGDILSEPVKVHGIVPKDQVKDYVLGIMEQCGLRDYYFERYPHEFSGGQRQRICIARALTVKPQLVVCDEPVSALDVSIQAQIINLLKKLQQTMGLTYVFISHDLSVVKHISDQIGVMYLGSMVEFGNKTDIFKNPLHPYTQALFSAVPNPNPDVKMKRIVLNGDIPSPANPPLGCKFHTRCPVAKEICKHVAPAYREYETGHFAACHCYPQE